eukprot:11702876-Prorocentrum_lima.AAC.1
MTSSLVGSEMCIRDRKKSPASSDDEAAEGNASPGVDMERKTSAKIKPVSYTHLTLPTICSV